MPRTPLYALTAAVFLLAAVALVSSPEPRIASAEVPPAPPVPEGPPSTASLLPGAADASVLSEIEAALTDQAASRATSTTTTTTSTTTTAPATDTTAEASAPPPTSPPSTNPPETTTTTTQAPPEGYFDGGAESDFAGRINATRSSSGKGALARDGSLDSYARSWAKRMGESGSLSHSNTSSLMPPWTAVAENVGQGVSVGQIFDLLAGSSGHLSSMLGEFTHMGVGVWVDPGGTLWTAHVFARS